MKLTKFLMNLILMVTVTGTSFLFAGDPVVKTPLDSPIPFPLQLQVNETGITFLANQIKYGLESKGLKKKIINALEGLTFETYMPVIGGKLKFTILGANDDNYDGVRYNRTEFKLLTVPPRILEKRATINELYPVLTVTADTDGVHPEIDLKIEHKFFTIDKVTIQADLEVTGIFDIMTANNQLRVYSYGFKSRLLYLYVPYVQLQIPGMPSDLMYSVEKAFNDYLTEAVKQFFEKDINKALASAIEDALNKLIFDKNEDGIPDTLIDLQELFTRGNSFLGTHIENNLNFSVEVFTDPPQVLIDITGDLYSNFVSDSVHFPQNWFYQVPYERDRCYGPDPPLFPTYLPGTTEPYMGGISINDDFINQILTLLYNEGLFNISINTSGLIDRVDEKYREYLTTKVFRLFNLEEFYHYFPDSYLQIDIHLREAPYLLLNNDREATIYLPDSKIDISATTSGGTYRLFSVVGSMSFGIKIEEMKLTSPFIIFSLSPSVDVRVTYNEIAPQYDEDIAKSFFPIAIGAVSAALPDTFKNFTIPVTGCIEGLNIKNFVVNTYGQNDANIFKYLQLLFNLDGIINIDNLLTNCLDVQNFSPVIETYQMSSPPSAHL